MILKIFLINSIIYLQKIVFIILKREKLVKFKLLGTLVVFFLFTMSTNMYSQSVPFGEYIYNSRHYYESIELLKDGTFKYYVKRELSRGEIYGNWQLRNDSILVLDSRPQRSQILVFESYKRPIKNNIRKKTVYVRDMSNYMFIYHLCLITSKKDTIIYKSQFGKTITATDFSSFYLINTTGLHSPIYKIIGQNTNFYAVFFYGDRVFENEYWKFHKQYIIPKGIDGQYSKYKLLKKGTD